MTDAPLSLDPAVRAYLARQLPGTPMRRRPVADVRREVATWAAEVGGAPEPVASVAAADADGVPARLYRPAGGERVALVWLHGGAWMLGDLDGCDAVARALANRSGCAVLSVDYRLAPEHRFPAAVDDAWTATRWASAAFDRIAVGGDSSGGNLAAAVALRARDARLPLALQLLVYPIVDYAVETATYFRFRQAYAEFAGRQGFGPTSEDNLRFMWDVYVPDPEQRLLPDAAPMRAATLRRVAPAVVVTAEHDILRHEGRQYAAWLEAEGVPVELHEYPGQVHGFFHMLGITPAAHDAVAKSGAAVRRGLVGVRSASVATRAGRPRSTITRRG